MKELKCKDCPYYTGIKCHGHGEFWATCSYIDSLRKILSNINKVYEYDLKLKRYDSVWFESLNDESTCLILEISKES